MVDEHVLAFVVGRDETKPGGRTSIQSAFRRRATPPHAAWRQERLKPCPGGRVAVMPDTTLLHLLTGHGAHDEHRPGGS